MQDRVIDAVAMGSCYVDTITADYPFDDKGILAETELVGGEYEISAGGSAVHFCTLLQTLGLKTAFVGMIGDDENGMLLEKRLAEHKVQAALIRKPGLRTNISFNMTNPSGKHIMLVAGTANAALSPEVVLPKLKELVPQVKMMYLGGCFKLASFGHAFGEIADLAEKHHALLVVDHGRLPASASDEMKQAVKDLVLRANYYLPSRDEFCQLWEVDDIETGLGMLHQKAPHLTVVVKDGANGAYYWEGGLQHVEAVKVARPQNVTGAGDSFNAGLMTALVKQTVLAEAIGYACKVAAAKITGQSVGDLE